MEEKISLAHALFIKSGVKIFINGKRLSPAMPEFASKTVEVAVHKAKVKDVDVIITVGLKKPVGLKKRTEDLGGWYLFCNGRMILKADRSERTGWGHDDHPVWHNKYNMFLGQVLFFCKAPDRLPWTTTKDDVQLDLPLYRECLTRMKVQATPVLTYLSSWYSGADSSEERELSKQVLQKAVGVSIDETPKNNQEFKKGTSKPKRPRGVRISYYRKEADIRKVRDALDAPEMPPNDIGKHTFDYFLEAECD